jgi:hypothetical protein
MTLAGNLEEEAPLGVVARAEGEERRVEVSPANVCLLQMRTVRDLACPETGKSKVRASIGAKRDR